MENKKNAKTPKYFREKKAIKKNCLDRLLKEKNMTAEELAKKIKVTPSSISQFKNSKANLTIQNIMDIATALDIGVGEIFGEIPVDYRNIINVKYTEDLNLHKNYENMLKSDICINYAMDSKLLEILCGIKKPADILISRISSNSMYETIGANDLIIIDVSHKKVIDRDGLYLMEEQNLLEIH
jgi:transcriptional regulator with XRE-family HTH domain